MSLSHARDENDKSEELKLALSQPFYKDNIEELDEKEAKTLLQQMGVDPSANLISLGRKIPKKVKVAGSTRDEKVYIIKRLKQSEDSLEEFLREVLAQEFDRLIRGGPQPKTRIARYKDQWILISEKLDITPLRKLNNVGFTIAVLVKKIIGLGSASIVSVFISDTDRHTSNIAIVDYTDKNGIKRTYVVNIDQAHSFKDLAENNLSLSAELIEQLPFIAADEKNTAPLTGTI